MSEINFEQLNALLGKVNLDVITADSAGPKDELPDGYYLSEVEKAELTTSQSSGNPMVAFQFSTAEDGLTTYIDNKGYAKLKNVEKTKGQKIWKYYPLVTEKDVNKFVSDMLKFEGSEAGVPLLPKEAFTTGEILEDALGALIGVRIYIQAQTNVKKGTDEKQTWYNFISWKRAAALELPL